MFEIKLTKCSVVSNPDKENIRKGLLQTTILEPDTKLASLAALTLSKIARYDFPTQWPEAINELMQAIRTFSGVEFQGSLPFQLRRSLLVLLGVVKEVVLNRIGPGRVRLKATVTETLVLLGSTYFQSFEPSIIQEHLHSTEQRPLLEAALEQSLLSIKTIRRLTVGLLDRPYEDNTVVEFWQKSLPLFQTVLTIILSSTERLDTESTVFQLIRKNLGQLAKFHVAMAKNNPTDFALLQPERYEVIQLHWNIVSLIGQKYATAAGYPPVTPNNGSVHEWDEARQFLIEKLGHQSLLLMRACIKMISMPGRGLRYRSEEAKMEDERAMDRMRKAMFPDAAILQLANHLVLELFLLQPKDLQEWEDDPDEWERREEMNSEDYDFATRPCAEKLLLDLALHFKGVVLEQILHMLAEVTAPGFSSILKKEAVYCAIGVAAPTVEKQLQFKTLLESNLIAEVQVQNPEYRILRRRIAILVGQWSTVQDAHGTRPVYYQLFQFLLNKEDPLNDQVVRVAAGRELGKAVDAWEYDANEFLPFADDLISRLMGLVEEVELAETKINLLNTISIIVERMEDLISPHAKRIVEILPQLWDQSGDEHMMKQVILGLLSRLFRSMKEAGASYHSLTLPLICETVTPGSRLGYVLLEDTLELWCVVVQQTPTPANESDVNPNLIALIQYLIPLLEHDTENLDKSIEILEAYTTLTPHIILSREVFPMICKAFTPKLTSAQITQSGYLTNALEHCLNSAVAVGGLSAMKELVHAMLETGLFDAIIVGLKESWEAHQTTGPKAIHTKIQGMVETDYFSLLSRITFASPELLLEALQYSPVAATFPENMPNPQNLHGIDACMKWLLEEWLSHAEDVHDPGRRKLMTLALTRLLDPPQPYMLHNMQSLLSLWTNMIVELTEGMDDPKIDSLVYKPGQLPNPESEPISSDEKRRTTLNRMDAIHTVNLLDLVRSCLGSFIQRCGGEEGFRNEVLVNVDKEVIDGFGGLGIL